MIALKSTKATQNQLKIKKRKIKCKLSFKLIAKSFSIFHSNRPVEVSPLERAYLYVISLKLLCECEWGTLFVTSLTPQMASSCAEPVRLRSLPRRRARFPGVLEMPDEVVCKRTQFGSVLELFSADGGAYLGE